MNKKIGAIVVFAMIALISCTEYVLIPISGPIGGNNSTAEPIVASQVVSEFDIASIVNSLASEDTIPGITPVPEASGNTMMQRAAVARDADQTLKTINAVIEGYLTDNFSYDGTIEVQYIGSDSNISSFSVTLDATATSLTSNESVSMSGTGITGTIEATIESGEIDTVTTPAILEMSSISTITVGNEEVPASGISGSGLSEYDPYTFTTASQLFSFAASVNNGTLETEGVYFALGDDIDLGGTKWTPIGTGAKSGGVVNSTHPFSGVFDGNNHTISNLSITTSPTTANDGVGLFGTVTGSGAAIRNLTVSGAINVSNSEITGLVVGLLSEEATIENCATTADSSITATEAGGIVGYVLSSGVVRNSINRASVTAIGGKAGGITCAAAYEITPVTTAQDNPYRDIFRIDSCLNYGAVTGTQYTGGIVGNAGPAYIYNCTNNGNVTATGASIGGIVGMLYSGGEIVHCTNNGDVTKNGGTSGDYGIGGIVGWMNYSSNAYNKSLLSRIIDSENTGDISVSTGTGVGGIIGMIYYGIEIDGCRTSGTITGTANMVGGAIGGVQYTEGNSNYSSSRLRNNAHISDTVSTSIVEVTGGDSIRTFIGHCVNGNYNDETLNTVITEDCSPNDAGSGITGQDWQM